MHVHRLILIVGIVIVTAVSAIAVGWPRSGPATATGGNVIITVDTTGSWTSLALDASGNPVVSYYDPVAGDLRVLHCSNPNCSSANSITLPDTAADVGQHTSLVLDSSGNPVISYYDNTDADLKLMHCNDPNCSGGDESVISVDLAGSVGTWNSLVLDGSGNPVISYFDATNADLKVMHCNDPNCAGGDESITSPDTSGFVGTYTSLALDSSGNPVVSYVGVNELRVLHCGDPNCGPGNVITAPHAESFAGFSYTSLVLDASGNAVVSYRAFGRLQLLHCNDASCAGGDDSITSPSSLLGITSLVLDGNGNPVVSFVIPFSTNLSLLHCDDPDCALSGEIITSPDTASVSGWSSLALDASGNPVVSYAGGGNLRVLHCSDPNCTGVKPPTPTAMPPAAATPTVTPTPTATPGPTDTPTVTPTPTPTKQPPPGDTDGDGCTDAQENGPDETLGGRRDFLNFWDFYDPTGDGSVTVSDFFALLQRFGAVGDAGIDPLSEPDPAPAYHTRFDRGGVIGVNPWNLGPPDGAITVTDFFSLLVQFGHSCA